MGEPVLMGMSRLFRVPHSRGCGMYWYILALPLIGAWTREPVLATPRDHQGAQWVAGGIREMVRMTSWTRVPATLCIYMCPPGTLCDAPDLPG